MKVTAFSDLEPRERSVAIGTFDGVHLGHREVIAGADTVLTFDPHPMSVTAPERAPELITSLLRKAELVESLGVEEMVVISFDEQFAQHSAEQFIDEVVVAGLGATRVQVGDNFGFGKRAQGRAELLLADDRFETAVMPLFELDGVPVSSSRIRSLLRGGEVAEANRLLGTPYVFSAEVARGDQRGRELGYPTANLVPTAGYCTPGHGVYAGRAELAGGETKPAAINVGTRPMFESVLGELIEAYLLDFDGDLYGQQLRVEFLERLRGEAVFESVDDLKQQMAADVAATRELAGG
ncbi:MAG: bifunctional riboflavin kinase/FAD synthetase [Solirubrobacterales bacterium]|nr:bifunctional riboflavin kinase/FAD synthetase [Solirubrobacterales bacterium]